MAIEQNLRFNVELNTTSAQSSLASMVMQTGQSMQSAVDFAGQTAQSVGAAASYGGGAIGGAYGSLGLGLGYARESLAGAGQSLQRLYGGYEQYHQRALDSTAGIHQGVINAAQSFSSAMTEKAGYLPSAATISGGILGAGHTVGSLAGWGIAGALTPKMGTLFRAGQAIGGAATLGRLGSAAVGVGAVFGGMMLPFMAADAIVNKVATDVREQQQIASAIGNYSQLTQPMFGVGGARINRQERLGMASWVQSMGAGMPEIGTRGMTEILHGFRDKLFRDPNLSPAKFREEFSKKVKLVKEYAEAFDQSIGQAVQTVRLTKEIGGGTMDPRTAAAMVHYSAGTAGLTTAGMVGVAQKGQQPFLALGMTPGTGAEAASMNAANVNTMRWLGMISKYDVAGMGGVAGAAQGMTQMQAQYMAGPMGQAITAAAIRGGKLDPSVISGIVSGKVGTGQMLGMGAGIAGGGLEALSDFYANKERYTSQITATQQQALMGSMAIRQLQMVGMPANETNLISVLRQRMPIQFARATAARIMNPQIYDRQIQSAMNQAYRKAADNERQAAALTFSKALGFDRIGKWGRELTERFSVNVSMPVGRAVASAGEWYQKTVDSMTGTSRYMIENKHYDPWALVGDAQATGADNDRDRTEIHKEVMERRARDINKLAESHLRIQEETGIKAPAWVSSITKKYKDAYGPDYMLPNVAAAMRDNKKLDLDQIIKGANKSDASLRSILYGMDNAQNLKSRYTALLKSRKINEVAHEMHNKGISKDGQNPRMLAARLSSAFGWGELDQLDPDKQAFLGVFMKEQGYDVIRKASATVNFGDAIVSVSQQKAKEAGDKVTEMVSGSTWSLFGSRENAVAREGKVVLGIFGHEAARATGMLSKDARVAVAEITSLAIKSNSNKLTDSDRNRMKFLADKVDKETGGLSDQYRRGISTVISYARSGAELQGAAKESANNAVKYGFYDDLKTSISTYNKYQRQAAKFTISRELGRRLAWEITSDHAYSQQERIARSVGITRDQTSAITGKLRDLYRGDPSTLLTRIGELRETLAEDLGAEKYGTLMESFKKAGGAYAKAAALFSDSAMVSSLANKKDLLEGISDASKKALSKEVIKADIAKIVQGKGTKEEKERSIKKYYQASVERALKESKDDAPTREGLRKIFATLDPRRGLAALADIAGKGDNESQRIFGMLMQKRVEETLGKTTGERVSGPSPVGIHSAIANKQIAMMSKYVSSLQTTQQTMVALHNAILSTSRLPKR
jgi:hypothetical protein